MHSQLVVYSIN